MLAAEPDELSAFGRAQIGGVADLGRQPAVVSGVGQRRAGPLGVRLVVGEGAPFGPAIQFVLGDDEAGSAFNTEGMQTSVAES